MQDKRILMIDDDPALLQFVASLFQDAGARVQTAADGLQGLQQLMAQPPDLVILDMMMPGLEGWEVCQRIRQLSTVPILMLTGMGEEGYVIRGLESGADDYLVKPFDPEILLARAKALLGRTILPATPRPTLYQDGYLTVDLATRQVQVDDQPVKLTETEYQLLAYLLQHANQVRTFDQILDHVWGASGQDGLKTLHLHISHLRQKLEIDPKKPRYLLTQYGVGYRFQKPDL